MMEEWKTIEGAENYEISSLGRVRTKRTGKIRKQCSTNFGYLQVGLRINGKTLFRAVHRLVAKAFLPNPNDYPEVNHKDFDRHNNSVDNLEWVNHKSMLNHVFSSDNPDRVKKQIIREVKKILDNYLV